MIFLFIASVCLVLYGTLFPFTFQPGAHGADLIGHLLNSIFTLPGRGDVLSNVVLFLPVGFFGMQSLPQKMPVAVRYALVFGFGTLLSLGIECTQFYSPVRTTSLYDLGLNAISTLIGAAGGRFNLRGLVAAGKAGARPQSIFPLALLAAWLGYRLFPYVPTIDFQHVKDAIKPLLAVGDTKAVDVIRHFASGLAVARLVQASVPAGLAPWGAIALVLGVIAAKPFIVSKVISPAEAIGATAAIVVWLAGLSRWRKNTVAVALVLVAAVAIQGLVPFTLGGETNSMSLIPFYGFTRGSMATNLQAFFEKVFLYGGLIWLVGQAGGSTAFSLIFGVVYLTLIEVVQMFLEGRSSEVTDPILAAVLGATLLILERNYRQAGGSPAMAAT